MLLDHFEDARNFVSSSTKNDFGKSPAHDAFNKLFVNDMNTDGISMNDLLAMETVSSSQEVAKLLTDMRGSEQFSGTLFSVAAGFNFVASGFSFLTADPILGAVFGVAGSLQAYSAYDYLGKSEVPKFSDYINTRRNAIASWK